MRFVHVTAFLVALTVTSTALAEGGACPKWEPGTRYPWQSSDIMRGDRYAWLSLEVNRAGYPLDCRIGKNNYPDDEAGVWVCKQYFLLWRGPQAAPSEPDKRTLQRLSFVPGYDHDMADRKARRAWFDQHPEARPECYPEPSRPDRMDL